MFRSVKTSSGKVVEQSISYEITEKHRTKSVSFQLKYLLKLTYPVVASTCMLITMAHSRSADRADNCTVNFSDVGTAHRSHTVSLR